MSKNRLTSYDPHIEESVVNRLREQAGLVDRVGGFPTQALATDEVKQFLRSVIPAREGGPGWGTDQLGGAGLAEMLLICGGIDLPLGRLVEGHVNAARLIFTFGEAPLSEKVAEDIRSGHLIAIWNTERPNTPLRFVADRGRLVLQGEKFFASGVGHVDRAVVSVIDPEGAGRLAYIKLDQANIPHEWWELAAMRASATGSITLNGIEVEPSDIFGTDGDYGREPDFSAGAWRTLAVQAGGLRHLAHVTRAHLLNTAQHEADPQKLRFATLVAHCQTAELWVERCAQALDGRDIAADQAVLLVNTARLAVTEAAEACISLVKQAIGARAFMPGNPAEKLLRDLDFYLRQPAPDQTRLDVATFHLAREDADMRHS